jgi:hypothetical protein
MRSGAGERTPAFRRNDQRSVQRTLAWAPFRISVRFVSNSTSIRTKPDSVDAWTIRVAPKTTSETDVRPTRSAKSLSIAAGAIHASSGPRFPVPRISCALAYRSCAKSVKTGSEKNASVDRTGVRFTGPRRIGACCG